MPRETLERARRHAKIVKANPDLFTESEHKLVDRFIRQHGWGA